MQKCRIFILMILIEERLDLWLFLINVMPFLLDF